MKTIKELEADYQEACECDEVPTTRYKEIKEAEIQILKDVLGLIDEKIKISQKALALSRDEKWIHIEVVLEELKARITGK